MIKNLSSVESTINHAIREEVYGGTYVVVGLLLNEQGGGIYQVRDITTGITHGWVDDISVCVPTHVHVAIQNPRYPLSFSPPFHAFRIHNRWNVNIRDDYYARQKGGTPFQAGWERLICTTRKETAQLRWSLGVPDKDLEVATLRLVPIETKERESQNSEDRVVVLHDDKYCWYRSHHRISTQCKHRVLVQIEKHQSKETRMNRYTCSYCGANGAWPSGKGPEQWTSQRFCSYPCNYNARRLRRADLSTKQE